MYPQNKKAIPVIQQH